MNVSNISDGKPLESLIFEGNADDSALRVFKLYYFTIDVVFILPTIFGNVLTLASFARFSVLRKSTSCLLIGNLALSDLLVGVLVYPINMLLLMQSYFITNVTCCLLHHSLVYSVIGTSVMNLFLLSLERFHAIRYPFEHETVFTKRKLSIAIVLIWILMFAFGLLPLFGWHKTVDKDTFICGATPLLSEIFTRIMCSLIVAVLVINGIFFFIIFRVAIKAASAFTDINLNKGHQERMRKEIRHTRMMLIVSGLFIVLWGPFCVMSFVPNPSNTIKFITAWFASLGLINSSLDWMVYGCRSRKFRIAFKAILMCHCDSANSEITRISS